MDSRAPVGDTPTDGESRMGDGPGAWPRVEWETLPWVTSDLDNTGMSRRRQLQARGPYQAAVPAFISDRSTPVLDQETTVLVEEATTSLTRFDSETGAIVAPFSAILLRSESSASSEIEQLTASAKSIAMAELGRRSGTNSHGIVANVRAMEAAIELADLLDADAIIRMQRVLLEDTHPEYTGRWRDQQVWIGGTGNSPHSASFVPPHHRRVPALMTDVLAFANRLDLPSLPQIAIAHAQFETVHPFPDGNGRTGRALVQALLRRLGVTTHVTVPVSAGLLRDTAGYFRALTSYREGKPTEIIRTFAIASLDAVDNGNQLVSDLTDIREAWRQGRSSRSGSAAARMLDVLQRRPVVDVHVVAEEMQISPRNAQEAIARLIDDGVLRQASGGTRNRVYEAPEVLRALDAFATRAKRTRGRP